MYLSVPESYSFSVIDWSQFNAISTLWTNILIDGSSHVTKEYMYIIAVIHSILEGREDHKCSPRKQTIQSNIICLFNSFGKVKRECTASIIGQFKIEK